MITKKETQKKWLNKNPWYPSFNCAKSRCRDKVNGSYEDYGKKGIKFLMTVDDFKTLWFRDKAYMMKRPSIDRKNNKKNYVKENCQFIELIDNCRKGGKSRSHKKISRLKNMPSEYFVALGTRSANVRFGKRAGGFV